MIEKINVNQINQPLGNYNANQYTFTEKFYYSGYIYNASNQNSLTIQIITEGNVLPNIVIPPNAILKIENLTIFQMNVSNGYYTFSFIGSNIGGIPKIDVNPQNVMISSFPYSSTGRIYASVIQVNTTANYKVSLNTYDSNIDNNLVYQVTLKADVNNTDYIYIFAYGENTGYPLAPGEELYLYMVNPSNIYIKTNTFGNLSISPTLYVIITGSKTIVTSGAV